eukprot:Phypoly_transcript_12135.p1 GENE.Phypoly_transcript_12135~~Phypoly_transcript_12135.p1  ORF type:complete len:376 (+),score=70.12 Phypoly_transcript_12135:59-1129(+)
MNKSNRDSQESFNSDSLASRSGEFEGGLHDESDEEYGYSGRKMTHYEDSVGMSDNDSMRDSMEGGNIARRRGDSPPNVTSDQDGLTDDEDIMHKMDKSNMMYKHQERKDSDNYDEEEGGSSDEDDDVNMDPSKTIKAGQGYGRVDVASMNVSNELKELFEYIGRFKPAEIELDTKMRPFIPDYIPSVGEIDAFIKVPKPDGKPDNLGLTVLDEPSSSQSDPAVLEMKLRTFSKQPLSHMVVHGIENAEKNKRSVSSWIDRISELHQGKPPPTINYAKPMPDIERLMQEWPPEIEELLSQVKLPTAELDADLKQFISIVCGILDIPVYNSFTDSLHVLFTLYASFRENQAFNFDPQE